MRPLFSAIPWALLLVSCGGDDPKTGPGAPPASYEAFDFEPFCAVAGPCTGLLETCEAEMDARLATAAEAEPCDADIATLALCATSADCRTDRPYLDGTECLDEADALDACAEIHDARSVFDGFVDFDGLPVSEMEGSATLTVRLSSSGQPMVGANLRLCRDTTCAEATTDADGRYAFTDVGSGWHALEVSGAPPHPTVLAPTFVAPGGQTVDLNVPALDPSTPLLDAPTEVEMGEGLRVTVSSMDLEAPLFAAPATEVAGVRVPAVDRLIVPGAREVLDQWYLEPYGHTAPDGLPVRFDNLWGAAEGATYEVWVASFEGPSWEVAGEVTAVGAFLEGDARLVELAPVALVRP